MCVSLMSVFFFFSCLCPLMKSQLKAANQSVSSSLFLSPLKLHSAGRCAENPVSVYYISTKTSSLAIQYPLVATKALLNFCMVVLRYSQHWVKVRESPHTS